MDKKARAPARQRSAQAAAVHADSSATTSANAPRTLLQVQFGAYAEPRAHAEKVKSSTFKVALVASDCLLLGERCAACGLR